VGKAILIDGLGVAVLLALWYLCFFVYNRRRGARALSWIEAACAGKGRITEFRWLGSSHVRAYLRFQTHWFENARITLRLLPRPVPSQWIVGLWRNQKETLTFEADLEDRPTLQLDLLRHRWLTHNHVRIDSPPENWIVARPGPLVLTTRPTWNHVLDPIVNTLISAKAHRLFRVQLSPSSPHLSATIDLESIDKERPATDFLEVLHELAVGASRSHQ
jgi:hypothetical protein